MRSDIFENSNCTCGSTWLERLEILTFSAGTDVICKCQNCDHLFIRTFERQVERST
jgi:hypothetical protein